MLLGGYLISCIFVDIYHCSSLVFGSARSEIYHIDSCCVKYFIGTLVDQNNPHPVPKKHHHVAYILPCIPS